MDQAIAPGAANLAGPVEIPDVAPNPNLNLKDVTRDERGLCLIFDRATRKMYRIGSAEFEWLSQLATRSAQSLAETCGAERQDHYRAFLEQAQRVGLLVRRSELHMYTKPIRRLRARGALQVQVHLLDPASLINKYKPLLLRFCSRSAVVLYAILLAAGLLIGITHASHIMNQLTAMPWRLGDLAYGWLALAGISVIHESAHMIAAMFYGVPVHSVGFMLFYLQPSMYAELTAMWSLKDGRKRAVISSAGIFAQAVLSAVLLIIWWAAERSGHSYPYVLRLAILNLSLALANTVPFIQLDGYWILSSLAQIPNLRLTAMRLVREPDAASPYSPPVTILLHAFGIACYITGAAFVVNGVAGVVYLLYRIGVPWTYIAALAVVILATWSIIRLQQHRRRTAGGSNLP